MNGGTGEASAKLSSQQFLSILEALRVRGAPSLGAAHIAGGVVGSMLMRHERVLFAVFCVLLTFAGMQNYPQDRCHGTSWRVSSLCQAPEVLRLIG